LIGAKYSSGVEGLLFDGFTVDANYKTQKYAYALSGYDHGKGLHNILGFGNMSDPQYSNVKNCTFQNLTLQDGQGDGIRFNGGSNLHFYNIICDYLGHDDIHLSAVNGADVYKVVDKNLMSNNLLRTRASSNIDVHECYASDGIAYDTGPAFQSENITPNRVSEHIRYFNNIIIGRKGTAFDCGAGQPAQDLQIYNNLIVDVGHLEKAINCFDVGAFTIGGWKNVKIHHNTVVDCKGYGVLDKSFKYVAPQATSMEVYDNIIVGTRPANTVGTASGSAITRLYSNTTISIHDNCLYNNSRDLYPTNLTQKGGISANPLFIGNGDYHLQAGSPCPSWGRYGDTQEEDPVQEDITKLLISCKNCDVNDIVKSISYSYKIYRGY
jgi:hypothetical protein